jgi:hypothetical protein
MLLLGHSSVTDEQLAFLESLPELRQLSLESTKITDAGVARLKQCNALQELHLEGCNVSASTINELTRSCPDLTVYF